MVGRRELQPQHARDGSELSTRDLQKMVQALPQYTEQVEKISLHVEDVDSEIAVHLKRLGRKDPTTKANPKVGKDESPDLAALVPSSSIVLPDQPEKQSSQVPKDGNHVSGDNRSKTVSAK